MVLAQHGQSYANDNLPSQQTSLLAVRNPTTFCKAEGGKKQALAAAKINTPNTISIFFFLAQSRVVSSQFSLPSHFLPWSLCCCLYSNSCFTGGDAAPFSSINGQQEDSHLRPVRTDSQEGALCRHIRLPLQRQKGNLALVFK